MDEEEPPSGNGSDLESGFLKEDHGKSQAGPESMDIDSPTKGSLDSDLNIGNLEKFCKEAARAFFKEWGLINHQISSYNDFVEHGIQDLFDTLGDVVVEPGYDPSKKGDGAWRHASITFGKVRLEKPEFWPEKNDIEEGSLKLLPRHARLQNMTYSSQMKVKVRVQVSKLVVLVFITISLICSFKIIMVFYNLSIFSEKNPSNTAFIS